MISAVLVSYRSAALAREAIESLRRDGAAEGLALETIVVVNSGDPGEVRALAGVADRVIDPGRNLGFSGGLNAGIRAARGETLLLLNPDVVVGEGALCAFSRALNGAAGAGSPLVAVGPTLFWDEGETLFLPPSEEPHPFDFARRRCSLDPGRAHTVFRRELRRVRRMVEAATRGQDVEVTALSGAFVATTRATLEAVGPFDEDYALYYEENDWQRRLRLLGGRLVRLSGARVVHRYNQSARLEPRAENWFAASEARYFEGHFGAWGRDAAARLAAFSAARSRLAPPEPLESDARERAVVDGSLSFSRAASEGGVGIAVSPLPYFRPFAYTPLPSGSVRWQMPADVRRGLSGTWYVRAVLTASGETLGEGRLVA